MRGPVSCRSYMRHCPPVPQVCGCWWPCYCFFAYAWLLFVAAAVLRYVWMGKTISKFRLGCMLGVMMGLSIVPLSEGLNFKSDSTQLMFGKCLRRRKSVHTHTHTLSLFLSFSLSLSLTLTHSLSLSLSLSFSLPLTHYHVFTGLASSFAATFFYALLYVSVERAMASSDDKEDTERETPTDPLRLIFWQAVLAVGILLVAFAGHHAAYGVPLPELDSSFVYPVIRLVKAGWFVVCVLLERMFISLRKLIVHANVGGVAFG